MTVMNIICFFDFDGTITEKDSLFDFVKFSVGNTNYYKGLLSLSPILLAFKLKFIPNHLAKEIFFSYFFKDYSYSQFESIASLYSLIKVDHIVRKKAIETILWHQKQGHKIVVVSASIECWLQRWCDKNNLELIATKLEVKDGKITGKFKTKNCYGIEKVNRIKKQYDLSQFDEIYAYGDSSGDKEMLSLAHKAYFKPFR